MSETCYELLIENANKKGVIVYYGHKVPIARFLQDVEDLAAGFSAQNLRKGDVVTLYLPTCPQSLAAFYACSKLGLVANVVHPLVPFKLLKENLQKVRSKALLFYDALVSDERPLEQLGQILVRCSIADYVRLRKPVFALYAKATSKRVKSALTYAKLLQRRQTRVEGCGDDLVCYMHSGGTSGNPKIVKLTNFAINQTALGIKTMYHPTVDENCFNLVTLPVFHAYGLCAGIHAPLIIGYSLVLIPKFKPKTVFAALKRHNVTCWSVVPAMLKKMLKAKCFDNKKALESLDVIWCGGDVLDESLVQEVNGILKKYCKRAELMRGYGLTEVCGVCVVNNFDDYKAGSCGKPMATCKAQIWAEDCTILPPNQPGEIVVCAQGNMQGYLEGDDCFAEKDGERWVLTGDVGYLDEDGFLYVVDRKKRSIKIAAVNVFPAQIEKCVKKLNFVDEACAVGVTVDDKPFVKVFVTLKNPLDEDFVQRAVIQVCTANLIRYSVPRFVEVLEEMPRTPLGKVDYKKLAR